MLALDEPWNSPVSSPLPPSVTTAFVTFAVSYVFATTGKPSPQLIIRLHVILLRHHQLDTQGEPGISRCDPWVFPPSYHHDSWL